MMFKINELKLKNMETIDLILKALNESGEPMKSGEIAEKLNIDKNEVDKAIKKLKKNEKIQSPKRCYYAPV